MDQANGEPFLSSHCDSADQGQIPNACGSIGLLHALMNLPDEGELALKADSPLKRFKGETLPLDREPRHYPR